MEIITNLDTIVDSAVTNNVNAQIAQQAVVDAEIAASNAEISANDADVSASAASASAISSANSATTAEVHATSAANSAANALASESIVANSVVEANAARVIAEQHRDTTIDALAQAQLVYDHFDDRYLGGHGDDPLVDNDGDDIVDGALYWNTTFKELRLFNQTALAWVSISDASGALLAVNNLSDVVSTIDARNNLDVYSKGEVDTKDIFSRARENHTGTQSLDTITETVDKKIMTADERTFVAEGTILDTAATTLAGAINELHTGLVDHEVDTSTHGVGEIVGTTETQTLTNKVIDYNTNSIQNIVDDTTDSIDRPYSGNKTQSLHNAQALAIAALATAQGQIANANTPSIASIAKYPLTDVLNWDITTDSTNTSIFELDSSNNVFTFKQNASFNFLSTVQIKSNVSASRTLKFYLIDNDTDTVLMEVSQDVLLASGNTESFPFSTLLTVGSNGIPLAPLSIRVEVSNSDTGFELRSFSSIVASSSGYGSENIDSINDSLGSLITATDITATTISGAVDELASLLLTQDEASEIVVVPNGNLSSNTVQLALEELQSDIDAFTTDVEW